MKKDNSKPKIRFAFSVIIPEEIGSPVELEETIIDGNRFSLKKPGTMFEIYRAICELKALFESRMAGNAMMNQMAQAQSKAQQNEESNRILNAVNKGTKPPIIIKH